MKTLPILLSCLFFSCALSAQTTNDPVLMTINGKPVTKAEFEYIYNKNNTANMLDKKSLEEYVDLFINFKLKVEEAKALGLDTTESFKREYASYRNQLAKPYLTDNEAKEALIKEAYEHMLEEVEASHIFVRLPSLPTESDTLEAWKKINQAYKRLNKEKFENVAKQMSEDESSIQNGGYIGWSTAFVYMYPFEKALYDTPVGAYSKPFRTNAGYHIIKVHDRRPSKGESLTAHIMTFTGENDAVKNKEAKSKIDSLYQLVQQGSDFGEVAKKYSEDYGSAMYGGQLPWFSAGRMPVFFEEIVYPMEKGEISKPVQSPDGWHIVKLMDRKAVPPYEKIHDELRRRIQLDERDKAGKDSLVARLKKAYNYQLNEENLNEFAVLLKGKRNLRDTLYLQAISNLDKPLFSFADKEYTQKDFTEYLKKNPFSLKSVPGDVIKDRMHEMTKEEILDYEDSQLENRYDDLRFLAQEYYDGILLFEVSNREVWEKASNDTTGLTAFFNDHKADYRWEAPHYKGRIVYAKDKDKLKEAKKIVKKSPANLVDKELLALNDSVIYIKTEKGLFVEGDNKALDEKIFKSKNNPHYDSEEYPYVYIQGKMLNYTPETYTDVRGLVTADYQNYLEQEWIKELRNKYPFSVNQEVLKTVKKN